MRVAAYQMPVQSCYGAHALERLRECVQECEDAGVDLLCCPEGALGGLADYVEAPEDIAVPSDPKALEIRLRPLASRTVAVVVGFTERGEAGRYYNAAAVYASGVLVGVYRKCHPAIRQSRYSAGIEAPVFIVKGMRIGILICRDSTDSRLAATLVQRGAHLLCIPTNNAMPPGRTGPQLVEEVRALDAKHAMHLGVSIVRADVVGTARGLVSAGASMITWPSGVAVRTRGIEEGELIAGDLTADVHARLGTESSVAD
jgi:5-aminopentanamidase